MKEIILLTVFLGVVFSFLWLVVLGAEKLLKKKRGVGFKGGTEAAAAGDVVRAVVVAGIMAYEEGVRGGGVERRKKQRRKVEGFSWWKKS